MTSGTDERQIFVFKLDGEEYAVDIENVREIIKSEEKEVTSIPNVPEFITGITNVRGQVVPILDLEEKFSLAHNENSYIVIIELNGTPAGLLVDDVKEVLRVNESKVKEAPKIIEEEIHRKYVKNVAVLGERMIIILDLKAGLKEHESVAVEEIQETVGDSEEEEEEEEVTHQDTKKAAMNRVSKSDSEDSNEKREDDTENSDDSAKSDNELEKEDSDNSEEESKGEFECDECGETFDTKRGLASHKVQTH